MSAAARITEYTRLQPVPHSRVSYAASTTIVIDATTQDTTSKRKTIISFIFKLCSLLAIVITMAWSFSRLTQGTSPSPPPLFRSGKSLHLPTASMAVIFDRTTSRYQVVDDPYMELVDQHEYSNRAESHFQKRDANHRQHNNHIWVTGSFLKNVDGQGWNYLDMNIPDMSILTSSSSPSSSSSSSPSTPVSSNVTIDTYLRAMEATGLLEGFVTCQEISQYYLNFYSGLFDGGDPRPQTVDFLLDNHRWMEVMSSQLYLENDYWLAVRGILRQLHGMVEGVKRGCPDVNPVNDDHDDEFPDFSVRLHSMRRRPSLIHFLLLNANGDLYQIAAKYDQQDAPPTQDDNDDKTSSSSSSHATNTTTERQAWIQRALELRQGQGQAHGFKKASSIIKRMRGIDTFSNKGSRETGVDHCSAIIKLLEDRSDVLFAHNTWDDFQTASPRIFKHYSFPVIIKGQQDGRFDMHFSSSPGFLTSIDDFFVVNSQGKLFVTETTLDLYDPSILENVHPESVLSWARSRVSNMLATSGSHWSDLFSLYHSGTYDNQWMVADLNRFKAGQDPLPGFLTVLEEVPGYIHSEDMTSWLIEKGYWASYNNPFFPDIAQMSGNAALCLQTESFCHDGDPRAKIFKQRQSLVKDIDSLKALIGYNDFAHDPLSLNDSCNAIACRQDLEPVPDNQYPFGNTDGKVTSAMLGMQVPPIVHARLGPTHDNQPPFCWSEFSGKHNTRNRPFSHFMHPECFDFDWIVFPPGPKVNSDSNAKSNTNAVNNKDTRKTRGNDRVGGGGAGGRGGGNKL